MNWLDRFFTWADALAHADKIHAALEAERDAGTQAEAAHQAALYRDDELIEVVRHAAQTIERLMCIVLGTSYFGPTPPSAKEKEIAVRAAKLAIERIRRVLGAREG